MIRGRWRHPGFFNLSRYVERGEDSADWGQLRSHLRDCTRCRDEVAWIKRLHNESRRLREAEPPAGVLDRILARRAAGERLILPVSVPPERPARRRAISWAGAGGALTLVAVVLMVSLTSQATAGSNNLSFAPRSPEPGEEIFVQYVPTISLAGADSLRLRVRFRASGQAIDEREYHGDYLTLTLFPDDKGVFEGRFGLPSTAAYAQMAVEDTRGTTVDSNNRRLWEILAHDENGQVRYEALRQRAYMAEWAQDWRRRKETSAEITRRFPDRPEGWSLRFRYEMEYTSPTDPDSVLAVHREALSRLEANLSGRDVGVLELAAMMEYADQIGEEDAAAFWERRLTRVATGHYRLQRRRVFRVLAEQADQGKVLDVVEVAWQSSDSRDWNLAQMGLDFALRTQRWARAEAWAQRLTGTDPDQAYPAGRLLAAHPRTRASGIDYLRQAASLSASNPDRIRPLGVDVLVYERERAQRKQRILTLLADALIESGETDEAAEVIVQAADLGWDPSLLERLAQHHLTLGDTATALDLLARAASDPLTGADSEGIGRDLAAASGIDPRAWSQSVAHEREQFRRWTLEAAEFRHLPPDVTVEAANGDRVTITSLVPSQPTLVAVTDFHTGHFAESKLPHLVELRDRLSERDLPFVVLITTWGDQFDFRALVNEHRPGFPVFYDSDNLAEEFFGVTRTTEYMVLDADGILRGTYWELDAALRLLYLLPRPPQVA